MSINTDQLLRLLGTEEAAQKFVALFRQHLPVQMEDLHQALEDNNWESASNLAHGLKSQCRYLGLDEAADFLQDLELNPGSTPKEELIRIGALLERC